MLYAERIVISAKESLQRQNLQNSTKRFGGVLPASVFVTLPYRIAAANAHIVV